MSIAVVLGSLLVALIGAGSAHAECDITSDSEIKAPKTAAAGATLKFKAYNDATGATLTVEAADPARPISHPYTRSDVPENWFDVTVKTERGDGPIRVRLDSDGSGSTGSGDDKITATQAELRTMTVQLADGSLTTVTVDVPPGTPIRDVAIPPVPGGSPTQVDAGGEQCHFELSK